MRWRRRKGFEVTGTDMRKETIDPADVRGFVDVIHDKFVMENPDLVDQHLRALVIVGIYGVPDNPKGVDTRSYTLSGTLPPAAVADCIGVVADQMRRMP